MMSILSGLVVGGGGASLWHFMPSNRQVHRLARAPLLDSLIPIAIVGSLAVGVALIVAGVGG